jgi:hypothetical protein
MNHYSYEKIGQPCTGMDTNFEASDSPGAAGEATALQDPVPTLGDAIIDEAKNRKPFGQGGVAFILDPNETSVLAATIIFQQMI